MNRDTIKTAAVLLAAAALFVLFGWAIFEDQKRLVEKGCRVVGHKSGGGAYGFGTDGRSMVIQTPPTTTWRCPDGVEYER